MYISFTRSCINALMATHGLLYHKVVFFTSLITVFAIYSLSNLSLWACMITYDVSCRFLVDVHQQVEEVPLQFQSPERISFLCTSFPFLSHFNYGSPCQVTQVTQLSVALCSSLSSASQIPASWSSSCWQRHHQKPKEWLPVHGSEKAWMRLQGSHLNSRNLSQPLP